MSGSVTNPLAQPGAGVWQPSTWQPGQPGTPSTANMSSLAMPNAAQIEQQRQLIRQRLRQYGYPDQQLSDPQVLATMTNLPQGPVQWPDWVQDYFKRHPGEDSPGARPGVDMPTNQTYEPYNLQNRAMGALTGIGSSYAIPWNALVEHYGQAAMDAQQRAWFTPSLPGQKMDVRTDYR